MKALLGAQTHFSFHWGVASPAAWFRRAEELGYAFLGIADNAAVHGLPEIVAQAKTSPVRPLYGAAFRFLGGQTVFAYAANALGYGNLCQRITGWQKLYADRPSPRAGGVPALDGAAARKFFKQADPLEGLALITDDPETWHSLRASGAAAYWRVGPTLAVPPGGIDPDSWVFAPGPVFLDGGDYATHRLLRAIGGAATLDRIPRADRYDELRDKAPVITAPPASILETPKAYADRFGLYADAIRRADDLAAALAEFAPCADTLAPPLPNQGEAAPEWSATAMAQLRRLAYDGAVVRYGEITPAVRTRLEHELELINRKRFAEYFLVVYDIVARMAGGDGRVRRGRSVTCGRGSGAASLVNYCLGVTNVDVLKHDLMFERFLNDARLDPPDIDIDFAWDERDDLLERVFREYGDDRVARVANHNRYDWRGAFRATARTLGYSDAEITRHLRESPSVYADPHPGHTPAPDAPPEAASRTARKLDVLHRGGGSDWDLAARLCERLIGVPHCLSMHCGGMVISSGPIARSVPTVVSNKGQPTIQWEKDGSEDMGLVKIDLLSNRSLAVIRDAIKAIAHDEGKPEDKVITVDPTDDPATQDLIRRGDTFGVFYLESPSMRLLMAKARQGDFAHAVVHSSIIRPAANAFINEYLRRLHGGEWKYEDECLEGLFEESYGIPVYQEDVVKLAMKLAEWDYTKADQLRKCLGKRDAKERLSAAFPDLAAAARARGVNEEVIAGFWRTLMSMTGYSFCKPHSASYAQVSFEAAYLRAHYPAYFIAAVLSNGGGFYTTLSYVSEAMRMGVRVLGPDVNASCVKWQPEGPDAIRTGLMAVLGLSGKTMDAIVSGRERGGAYADLDDFLRRARLDGDDLRRLALVGGLDSLAPGLNRPQILWCATQVAGEYAAVVPDAGAGMTGSLFDRMGPAIAAPEVEIVEPLSRRLCPPRLPPYTKRQAWAAEYAALGFVPGFHPMVLHEDEIREGLRQRRARQRPLLTSAGQIRDHVGKLVTILAWPVAAKIVETKHGDAMMFQSFEDHRTLCETIIFPEEFRKYHRLLGTLQPLWVTGRVEEEFEVATLRVLGVERVCADMDAAEQLALPGVIGGAWR